MESEQWAISQYDEEPFYGDYSSRDEAIKAGYIEYGGNPFYVGKIRPPRPISQGIFADGLIESAVENLEEEYCLDIPATDDWKPTQEQYNDLEKRLAPVIDAWVRDHGLTPTWLVVDNIQRIEPVEVEG